MRVIDLTLPITTGMPVYPGDPEVRIEPALTIARDGAEVARVSLGSHTGTHLDAPAHLIPGGAAVDRFPLELLVGPARILRCALPAGAPVAAPIRPGDVDLPDELPAIACIATGWSDRLESSGDARDAMRGHPWVALELAEELWRRGSRVLGVDMPSPDPTGPPEAEVVTPVHEYWLGNGGAIVENLVRLDRAPDEVQLSLLPLRLAGVDGSPIRAIAIVP